MKLNFSLFIICICIVIVSCSIEVKVEDVKGSKLEYLNDDSSKDSILIVDVRTYDEYKKGHLPNAINIPIKEIKLRINEITDWQNKPIYVYAETNDESFKAAEILVANRFDQIYNADGITQYNYKTVNYNLIRGSVFESMLKNPDIIVLDCRNNTSYNIGHIPGSMLFQELETKNQLNNLPKNKKILVYCTTGLMSSRAAQSLSEVGYTEIYSSIDGVSEYPFKLVKDSENKN